MRSKFWLLLLLLALLGNGYAADGFILKDIRVEGLQRITAGTVFNYLPVKPGDRMSAADSPKVIRALFKTGFFKDVRLEHDESVLVIHVTERPAISEIKFSGNKSIDEEALKEGLKDIGLSEGRTFNRSVLDRIKQELERQFYNLGKYAVKLTSTVTPLERNRVAISFDIIEGETARIKDINIIGNSAFEEEDLLDEFKLSTGGWLSTFTKDDQYSRQKLGGDLETLRSWYLDRGYVNFKIDSTQVTITPDKHDIYVTVNINEGEIHTLSDIRLAGELIGNPEDYFPLIHLRRNEPFARRKVVNSNDRISSKLSDLGYAFANVNSIPEIDEENKTVSVTFFVDPGKRVYVRRIDVSGNSRTRDEVIRREFRQMESAWFSSEKLKLSRERTQRTGFFEQVSVETPTVPGSSDEVDVKLTVTEKPSGSILAGLGYSQSDGIVLNASVSQDNFLGTGKKVSLAFKTSGANEHYQVSYLNPYYTVDGISRGFDLVYKTTDFEDLDTAEYSTNDAIAGVSYGIPLSEFNRFNFGFSVHDIDFETGNGASTEVLAFEAAEGNHYLNYEFTVNWSHDSRDSAILPTRGSVQILRGEATFPGSDLQYFKVGYSHRKYWPISDSLVLSLNGSLGYGDSFGGTDRLPFFENYFGGGTGSVRGFSTSSLGPRDSRGDPLGGNSKIIGNAEVYFPPPFYEDSLRLLAFVDAGAIFDTDNGGFDTDEIRYSAGVGGTWLSPVGAVTISYAIPFRADDQDEEENFQFSLGTSF